MYDKSRVSKLTHFVYFVLKVTERLSSEKDVWKWNCEITSKWYTWLYSTHWIDGRQEELGEMEGSRLESSYVEDTFRYNHCYMCVVYSTLLCI